jgi:hypothetical protein
VASFKLVTTVGILVAYAAALAFRSAGRLVGQRFSLVCALLYVAALFSLWPVSSSRPASVTEPHPAVSPEAVLR